MAPNFLFHGFSAVRRRNSYETTAGIGETQRQKCDLQVLAHFSRRVWAVRNDCSAILTRRWFRPTQILWFAERRLASVTAPVLSLGIVKMLYSRRIRHKLLDLNKNQIFPTSGYEHSVNHLY